MIEGKAIFYTGGAGFIGARSPLNLKGGEALSFALPTHTATFVASSLVGVSCLAFGSLVTSGQSNKPTTWDERRVAGGVVAPSLLGRAGVWT